MSVRQSARPVSNHPVVERALGGGVLGLYIRGAQQPARDGDTLRVLDPATGRPVATISCAGPADIDDAVEAAQQALTSSPWSTMTPAHRSRILMRIAQRIRERADDLAHLESLVVGKPLSQARADVEVAARYFEFYGGVADKLFGTTIPLGEGLLDYTVREPIGVSGQIIPFNYPIQNTARGGAPALAAGCTVVLKPSPEAPLSPLAVARIAAECGLPAGVLNVVPGRAEAGKALAGHRQVNQITFTGSVATGVSVAKAAAENVVPTVVELGGKSPSVVFADADLDGAVAAISGSVFGNSGQTCSATTRLLVERGPSGESLIDRLVDHARGLRLGPGLSDPDMGPLISARQRDRVVSYLELAEQEGASVLVGGRTPDDEGLTDGYFVEPTLLRGVRASSRTAQEEIFGPVLTVLEFDDPASALELANATPYGLSSSVWTRDLDKAMSLASRIKAGQVYINTTGNDTGVEAPFGGYKKSGWGREKGLETFASYTQTKNVCIGYRPSQ